MGQEGFENDREDEVMLPGFRFHPTDEELVGFYLRRKVHHKPLSIELIKQLDIYKFDPWDLPKMATTGEKEWYFYCPRDRKYRNSARPNRVTGAGFWKATGTDRPIYSSDGSKCIGLKKSLVFYKGRAARGSKTDWMMHEFRLPSLSPKKHLDKDIPPTEAWAICRIFKKANSTAQRALSQPWISPVSDNSTTSDSNLHFSCSYTMGTNPNKTNTPLQLPVHQWPNTSYAETTSQEPASKIYINDASSLLLDMSTSVLGDGVRGSANVDFSTLAEPCSGLISAGETEVMQENVEVDGMIRYHPRYSFVLSSNLLWDSSPCPSELSTAYSTNNCYT